VTSTESWLIVGVILLIVIGSGVLWFTYQLWRDQQRIRRERGPGLPPSTAEALLPPSEPLIRWGDISQYEEAPPAPPEPDRIRWGEEWEWIEASPGDSQDDSDDSVSRKCPICRQPVSESQDDAFVCPECQTVYHQKCWQDFHEICLICRSRSR
jgi:hypothetical protein